MPEKPLSRRVVSAGGRILRATRRRVEPNLSPEMRRRLSRAVRAMPDPMAQRVRGAARITSRSAVVGGGRGRGRGRGRPALVMDPLDLLVAVPAAGVQMAGRAAAAVRDDAGAAARLDRALHGSHPPVSRPAGGGRRVAVLARPEIEEALVDAGHAVEPLVPGTARAVMARVEVAVLDLEGFTGVWGGALDAEGVGLAREVMTAVEEGARRGVTTWLAAGTGQRSHLGAPTLLAHPNIEALDVLNPAPPIHYTQDPTDAPRGVADVVLAVLHDAEPHVRPLARETHA
ncbi:hypothetical protein [Micrococcus luteus]|uniref:hypothetical protein n=1 Tax=Micrococcus luteus TaxID=1270 RepID=UPI003F6E1360